MKINITPCLEQHLPDKAKFGNAVPEDAWFDAATAHLKSARLVIGADPSGAFMLAWASMHNTAKGVAAVGGARLEGKRGSSHYYRCARKSFAAAPAAPRRRERMHGGHRRLVVMPIVGRGHDASVPVLNELRDLPVAVDIAVVDPAHLDDEASVPGVVRAAVREGKVLLPA